MELKIKKLREGAHIPKRATAGSAGMDLYACIPEAVTLAPGQLRVIPTGIAIELPDASCAAFLYARSGLGVKHGIWTTAARSASVSATCPTSPM